MDTGYTIGITYLFYLACDMGFSRTHFSCYRHRVLTNDTRFEGLLDSGCHESRYIMSDSEHIFHSRRTNLCYSGIRLCIYSFECYFGKFTLVEKSKCCFLSSIDVVSTTTHQRWNTILFHIESSGSRYNPNMRRIHVFHGILCETKSFPYGKRIGFLWIIGNPDKGSWTCSFTNIIMTMRPRVSRNREKLRKSIHSS